MQCPKVKIVWGWCGHCSGCGQSKLEFQCEAVSLPWLEPSGGKRKHSEVLGWQHWVPWGYQLELGAALCSEKLWVGRLQNEVVNAVDVVLLSIVDPLRGGSSHACHLRQEP